MTRRASTLIAIFAIVLFCCRINESLARPSKCVHFSCKPLQRSWPELLGARAADAQRRIEADDPNVFVVILGPHSYVYGLCCNRVVLYVDDKNTVIHVPTIA
ncbi:hypothetical protein ACHQM5_018327 [Ranunculus cassubicifolius]